MGQGRPVGNRVYAGAESYSLVPCAVSDPERVHDADFSFLCRRVGGEIALSDEADQTEFFRADGRCV